MQKKEYSNQYKNPKWQKKRLDIMSRDKFRCVACGESEKMLSVHHGFYTKGAKVWEYDSWALTTLCVFCHEAYHEHSLYSLMKPALYLAWMTFIDITVDLWGDREEYRSLLPEIIHEEGRQLLGYYSEDQIIYKIVGEAIEKKIGFSDFENYLLGYKL